MCMFAAICLQAWTSISDISHSLFQQPVRLTGQNVCCGVALCGFPISVASRASLHDLASKQTHLDGHAQLAKDEAHLPCNLSSPGVSARKIINLLHSDGLMWASRHEYRAIWHLMWLDHGDAAATSLTRHCRPVCVAHF